MELSRYDIIDAYTLEELRRTYHASDSKGRIRLLQKLHRDDRVAPFEIALMAVEDQHVEVRQWMARYGRLDYRDRADGWNLVSVAGEVAVQILNTLGTPPAYEYPSRNLADRLKNDPDQFVRACLRENTNVFDPFSFITHWKEYFQEATPLERLALVRNPEVSRELIERIFDPEDQELEINLEERKELALAFLTNKEALASSKADAALVGHPYPPDGWAWYSANKFLRTLWELASKWPKESKIQLVVYRCVPAEDTTKAEIYRACDVPVWRQMILENCNADDTHTIEVGMRDADDMCRTLAYSKVRDPDREVLEALLQGEDKIVLGALAGNRALSVANLEKVKDRLDELNDDLGAALAKQTIEQLQKARAPKDPEELFGYEGRQANFLEEKIDLIGKKLLEVAEHLVTVNDGIRQVTHTLFGFKAVLSLVAIGVGVAILLSLLLRLFK